MADPKTPVKPVEVVKPPRKARVKAPENESKADKFKRLANHRVPRLLKLFKAIGSLGNKSQYEATDEQLAKILQVVQEAYGEMKTRLYGAVKEERLFKL